VVTNGGDRPQIPTNIPQGKPLAERLPAVHDGSVAVQVSFTFRRDASPVHNRSDSYVSLDVVPSGNVTFKGAVSISHSNSSKCSAGWFWAEAGTIIPETAVEIARKVKKIRVIALSLFTVAVAE
jgi:hypothetical protein